MFTLCVFTAVVSYLVVAGRHERPDLHDFEVPTTLVSFIKILFRSRDKSFMITSQRIYKTCWHLLPLPLQTCSVEEVMKLTRWVPVGTSATEGIVWQEPCLTKGCQDVRRDGCPCEYGHPIVAQSHEALHRPYLQGREQHLES